MIDDDGRVVHEARFAHSVEQVWNAIARADALAQWLMPNDFEPRVGHVFTLDAGPPRGLIDAEVLELDPPTRMQWRWTIDGVPTTVTITLRADADGTVLELEHTGLPTDPRGRFDRGWVDKFDRLTHLLEGAT